MSAYRFCRSDDVGLLVEAYNACYRVHFPALPELDADTFKRWIRRLDLWTSSCMIARSGDTLIGVLLAAKRERESLILAVGVRPGFQRQEHGLHMIQSLSAKLAILGPPLLRAELDDGCRAGDAFLAACGFERRIEYHDFSREPQQGGADPPPVLFPVTASELEEMGGEGQSADPLRCWERGPETVRNLRERARGFVVASGERVEAHLLYHDREDGTRELLDCGTANPDGGKVMLALLFRHACETAAGEVRFRRVHAGEVPLDWLESWGFERTGTASGYTAVATPG